MQIVALLWTSRRVCLFPLIQYTRDEIQSGFAGNPADETPIIGYQSNGNSNQRWAILPSDSDSTAYV